MRNEAETWLRVRRLNALDARRKSIMDKQERMRRNLPPWMFAPLQMVGMTSEEIKKHLADLSAAEQESGLDRLDAALDKIEGEITEIEDALLATPARSAEAVHAVLRLAIDRMKAKTSTDPDDVFYDYGDARILRFLERASDDLATVTHDIREATLTHDAREMAG